MLEKESALQNYAQKKARLIQELQDLKAANLPIGLNKKTTNLFRKPRNSGGMEVSQFNQVIEVDPIAGTVDVEGMTTFEHLVDACLAKHCLPTVVPQLKTITVGGALTGCGIESSSFKYGLVHETVLEFEVLLPDGRVVLCTPTNEYSDLYQGFANSYGTLGYALRLKIKIYPVKDFVKIRHKHFTDQEAYFKALEDLCLQARNVPEPYFIDGVAFAKDDLYLSTAECVDSAPFLSDYTYKNIYYRSLKEKDVDYLSIYDYIWRWDTDWFWCSKVFFAENPILRRLLGKKRLNSAFYGKARQFFSRNPLMSPLLNFLNKKSEFIIQDVQIPTAHCSEFLSFFADKIGISPIWLCPTMPYRAEVEFNSYPMQPELLYVNFGFWDKKQKEKAEGYYNRLIEQKVQALSGKKSLYSDSYYTKKEFMAIYNQRTYDSLKAKYDPENRLRTLYDKCCDK